ncbi:CesT family type III secretion system chaperone [Pandoraea pneumonica]|uniref:CesT family type III secretion system chaperone n=1 Tax=Pandoraea pneumonica TaxID=2508299 RepID=UPI003CE80E9E
MTQDLHPFHNVVGELLLHIGFPAFAPEPDQEVVSLDVEDRLCVHFGAIDQVSWFMLAEINGRPSTDSIVTALQANHLRAAIYQPVVSLNDDGRLNCWLKMPLAGHDRVSLADAFGELIDVAQTLPGAG